MLVTQLDEALPRAEPAQDSHPRPPGLHLSDIISRIMTKLFPAKYGKDLDWLKITSGVGYERILEQGLRQMLPGSFRPNPVQKDGIWCSPDGINPVDWSVDEFKLTWYSALKVCPTDPVYWPWLVQIRSYCHVLHATEATLRVFFVNGDYQPPKPRYAVYRLAFTELELRETWEMILNTAKSEGML